MGTRVSAERGPTSKVRGEEPLGRKPVWGKGFLVGEDGVFESEQEVRGSGGAIKDGGVVLVLGRGVLGTWLSGQMRR